jgi:tetratricopeptide (TPR) repeat protein
MPLDQLDPEDIPHHAEKRRDLAALLLGKAHEAMQRRELLVATLHACDALMLFPNEREYLDLFDEIVLSVPDPLTLLPTATGAIHVATAAGKARVLMMQSKLPDALDLVCAAVRVAPDIAYLDWVRRWLMPQTMQLVSWDVLFETAVKTAINVAVDVPVPPEPDDDRLPNVRAAAEYLAFLRQQFPNEKVLYIGETIARRRLGDTAATLKVAEDAVKRFPEDWNIRTTIANALCDAKRPDEAIGHARKAMNMDPKDCSPLHDVAWGFVDAGRASDAAPLFDEILKRDPHYPGAPAGLHYARWIGQHSEPDRQALIALRDRQPYDGRARALANEIDPPDDYINVLPGQADATASAARHLLREIGPILQCCGAGATVGYELSSRYLDSPSVSVAFEIGLRSMGAGGGAIECEPAEVQQPDPRADKAQLPFRVWATKGTSRARCTRRPIRARSRRWPRWPCRRSAARFGTAPRVKWPRRSRPTACTACSACSPTRRRCPTTSTRFTGRGAARWRPR